MTKEDLFSRIDKKIEELSTPYKTIDGWDRLNEYSKNHHVKTLEEFLNLDIWECIKYLYYIRSNKAYTLEEIDTMIEGFKQYFQEDSIENVTSVVELCNEIIKQNLMSKVQEYMQEQNVIKEQLLLRKMFTGSNHLACTTNLKQLKKIQNDGEGNMIAFFKLLEANPEVFLQLLIFYHTHTVMAKESKEIKRSLQIIDSIVSNGAKNRAYDNYFQEHYYVNELLVEVNSIGTFVKKNATETRKKERYREEQLRHLERAKTQLEKGVHQEEITNAREIVVRIEDLSLKRDILQFIYDHNAEYYQQLEEEYEALSHNSKSQYKAVLKDYGLLTEDHPVENIMQNSITDVQEMLALLKKMNIDFNNAYLILENSDLETVRTIKGFFDKGYFSKTFLNYHVDIFYNDSQKLQLFKDNMEFLNSYGINPLWFSSSLYVLLEEPEIFKENIKICNQYKLLKYFKTTNDYRFLQDKDLKTKIDRYLELGYESFLEEDLGILNITHWKRLEVLHVLSMPIDTVEEFKVLGEETNFFIPDDKLDDYIPNVLAFHEQEYEIDRNVLSSLQKTPRTYQIANVLVSIPKVERLQEEGYSLYQAIFSGLKLSQEEYDKILQTLGCKVENYSYKIY